MHSKNCYLECTNKLFRVALKGNILILTNVIIRFHGRRNPSNFNVTKLGQPHGNFSVISHEIKHTFLLGIRTL